MRNWDERGGGGGGLRSLESGEVIVVGKGKKGVRRNIKCDLQIDLQIAVLPIFKKIYGLLTKRWPVIYAN